MHLQEWRRKIPLVPTIIRARETVEFHILGICLTNPQAFMEHILQIYGGSGMLKALP